MLGYLGNGCDFVDRPVNALEDEIMNNIAYCNIDKINKILLHTRSVGNRLAPVNTAMREAFFNRSVYWRKKFKNEK